MEIKSSVRNYTVHFANEFAESVKEAAAIPNAFTVVDANVYRLYKDIITAQIKGPLIEITAVEENKTFEKTGEYIRQLLEMGIRKNNQLVVIGGGIVQDIGAFMASILFRGIEYTLLPTTLLAQCDSCIGSKSSMNIANYKNQLGTFYPPTRVLISASVLGTLVEQDLHSGICEALKLAMIEGRDASKKMDESLKNGLNSEALQVAVRQALEIKKVYIEEDEFDKGRRNLLNYGHTFGHAFESKSGYKIPHGIAVGIGMVAAKYFSWKRGMITEAEFNEARELMNPWVKEFMPELRKLNVDDLIGAMKNDKKSSAGQIGFILTRGFGKMERSFLPVEESRQILKDWLQSV